MSASALLTERQPRIFLQVVARKDCAARNLRLWNASYVSIVKPFLKLAEPKASLPPAAGAPFFQFTATVPFSTKQPSENRTWLILQTGTESLFSGACRKVQVQVRRLIVENIALPRAKHAIAQAWIADRGVQLTTLRDARKEKVETSVARLLLSLPRTPVLRVALEIPNKAGLVDLTLALESLIGLAPVKEWVAQFVDNALRFHAASKQMPKRHVIISGPLGPGKVTAAKIIAKALYAVGSASSETLSLDKFQSGRIVLMNLDNVGYFINKPDELMKFDEALASVDSTRTSSSKFAAFVIITGSNARKLAETTSMLVTLRKREPERLILSPHTSLELAQIALQKISGKMALAHNVTVKLIQEAIEFRWTEGERKNRNVYIAQDMATYLEQEIVLKETKQIIR